MHGGGRLRSQLRGGGFVPAVALVLLCLLVVVVAFAAFHAVDLDHDHHGGGDDCGVCSAVLLAEPALGASSVVVLAAPVFSARASVARARSALGGSPRRAHRARAPPAHA